MLVERRFWLQLLRSCCSSLRRNPGLIKASRSSAVSPRAGGCPGTELRVPRDNLQHQDQQQVGGRRSSGKDSRQSLVIIDEVGHTEEFLDRLHHFGGFRSEQLAVQDQDLQGARPGSEVPLAPSSALLGAAMPSLHLSPSWSQTCHQPAQGPLLNADVPQCSLTLAAGKLNAYKSHGQDPRRTTSELRIRATQPSRTALQQLCQKQTTNRLSKVK